MDMIYIYNVQDTRYGPVKIDCGKGIFFYFIFIICVNLLLFFCSSKGKE